MWSRVAHEIGVAWKASGAAIKSGHFYPFGVITGGEDPRHPPQASSSFCPRYCAIVRGLAPLWREYALKGNDATVSPRTLLSLPSSRRNPLLQDIRSRYRLNESTLILTVELWSRSDKNGDQNVSLSVASVLKISLYFRNQGEDWNRGRNKTSNLTDFHVKVYS